MPGSVTYTAKKGLLLTGTETGAWLASSVLGTVNIDFDLSDTNHDLTSVGSVEKKPVLLGSSVLQYTEFSTVNYLTQSHEIALEFGTDGFTLEGWVFVSPIVGVETFISIANPGFTAPYISLGVDANGFLSFATDDGTTFEVLTGNTPILTNKWVFVSASHIGLNKTVYLDSMVDGTSVVATHDSYTDPTSILTFGVKTNITEPLVSGSLALWRVYSSDVDGAEVSATYKSEKDMFEKNSVFTQVGLSYGIDLALNKVDRDVNPIVNKAISLGGVQETLLHRMDVTQDINMLNIKKPELPRYRTFLDSVQAGEIFILDPYGTLAIPDRPVAVIADPGYREQRSGTLELFDIGIKVREV